MRDPSTMRTAMSELTDAEYRILLSLDFEVQLHQLLMPIEQHVDGQVRQIRPALAVPEAAEALASLAERGLAEVRALESGIHDWDTGRLVDPKDLRRILGDPTSWSWPLDRPDGDPSYWAAATDDGEAAYSRAASLYASASS